MIKRHRLSLLVIIHFTVFTGNTFGQSQSDYALIRYPVYESPTVWKLTEQYANNTWGVDLFSFPVSGAASYVADPSYNLYSGVSFHLDRSWNRIIYNEVLSNWNRAYGSFGQSNHQFWSPGSLDALAPGDETGALTVYYIYVSDTRNNRIARLLYDWPNQIMNWTPPITGLGLFRPAHLNLNDGGTFLNTSDNYLWVINAPNGSPHQIMRISVGGTLLSSYSNYGCGGMTGHFCKISSIASARSIFTTDAYASTDWFYVADVGNNRIVRMTKYTAPNGRDSIFWLSQVPSSNTVSAMEVDYSGHLWVTDSTAGTITKYTATLFPLCTYGTTGTGPNQFIKPNSIGSPVGYLGNANMFVMEDWTDSSGLQIFAFGTDVVDFSVSSSFDQYVHNVNFILISNSKVRINIYNTQGVLVKNILSGTFFSGDQSRVWDGKNSAGVEQPTGEYRVQIIDSSTVIDGSTGNPVNVVTKEAWFHHEFNCCNADGIRGDANGICVPSCINVQDINFLIARIFQGGPPPPCLAEGNVNGIGGIDVLDLTYLVDRVFRGGPPPPACP